MFGHKCYEIFIWGTLSNIYKEGFGLQGNPSRKYIISLYPINRELKSHRV